MLRIASMRKGGAGSDPWDCDTVLWSSDDPEWRIVEPFKIKKLIRMRTNPYDFVLARHKSGRKCLVDLDFNADFNQGLEFGEPHSLLGHLLGIDELFGVGMGVLYLQSCQTRFEEAAAGGNLYTKKFYDEWPERFAKTVPKWRHLYTPPGGEMGLPQAERRTVSEFEISFVPNFRGKPILFAPSDDKTRSGYEGDNIINLPVAKTFFGCISAGPWWTMFSDGELEDGELPSDITMNLTVIRDGEVYFWGEANWGQMSRPLHHLVNAVGGWVGEEGFHKGIVVQTGTGIIMGEHPLQPGDLVTCATNHLGSYQTGNREIPTWTPPYCQGQSFDPKTLRDRFGSQTS